jgi:hypothetical protein
MSYPGLGPSQGGSATEHERDGTNDDASDHAAAVRPRAPIYHVIDVQRRPHEYRNQECISEPGYRIHHRRRDRRQIFDPE